MNIKLRPANSCDSKYILDIRMGARDHLFTPFYGNDISQEEWMARTLVDSTKILFIAEDVDENEEGEWKPLAVGYAMLHDIDDVHCRCMGQVQIAGGQVNVGYGTAAWSKLLNVAFNELGMNKVYLEVFADNEIAIHVYRKLGFGIEGTLLKHYWHDGEYRDVYVMGLLMEDYL